MAVKCGEILLKSTEIISVVFHFISVGLQFGFRAFRPFFKGSGAIALQDRTRQNQTIQNTLIRQMGRVAQIEVKQC
ncbi:hypothetical protein [Roseicitreum antarcticum]|uniref:hypothetical protein n=1 Tax=Roseicitreum antarcticum TaxID=564137 RepID=UPI00115FEB89|nr:hypothetical protein [Roseicitreum antarcticum]